jgi:hypothetical protein
MDTQKEAATSIRGSETPAMAALQPVRAPNVSERGDSPRDPRRVLEVHRPYGNVLLYLGYSDINRAVADADVLMPRWAALEDPTGDTLGELHTRVDLGRVPVPAC